MTCEICGHGSCTRSFHSITEQEEFDTKTGSYAPQPTIEELAYAWRIAVELELTMGAGTEAKIDLQRIRDRKTTWYGKNENDLRVGIDEYLKV